MRTYRRIHRNLIPFIDYHTNILLILIIILAFSSIIKKNDDSPEVSEIYQVVMVWDKESATDMDLWARDPDGNIVGFNRREGGEGSLFSLKRDDLGKRSDMQSNGKAVLINEEIISLRGTKEGEYSVNAHCYTKAGKEPTVIATVKLIRVKPLKEIVIKERTFKVSGDEQTFFRFVMDKNGEIKETNELPTKIAQLNSDSGEADVGDEEPPASIILPPLLNPAQPVPPGAFSPTPVLPR